MPLEDKGNGSTQPPARTVRPGDLTPTLRPSFAFEQAVACGFISSAPGHSTGVAPFTDYFIAELGVSRSALATRWALALCASALCAPLVGDRAQRWRVGFCP